jgi:phosphinothricin acetyltransferase
MHIRLATADDLDAINDIYNHYVVHSTCTAQYQPTTPAERRAWFDARQAPRHPVIVGEREGVILGYACLQPYNLREGYRFTVENSIYVRHDVRRAGVGRALLDALIDRARAAGYKNIIASISGDQDASMALHARAGFVEVGRMPKIVVKLDRWLDVVYMQLLLH